MSSRAHFAWLLPVLTSVLFALLLLHLHNPSKRLLKPILLISMSIFSSCAPFDWWPLCRFVATFSTPSFDGYLYVCVRERFGFWIACPANRRDITIFSKKFYCFDFTIFSSFPFAFLSRFESLRFPSAKWLIWLNSPVSSVRAFEHQNTRFLISISIVCNVLWFRLARFSSNHSDFWFFSRFIFCLNSFSTPKDNDLALERHYVQCHYYESIFSAHAYGQSASIRCAGAFVCRLNENNSTQFRYTLHEVLMCVRWLLFIVRICNEWEKRKMALYCRFVQLYSLIKNILRIFC